MPGGTEPEGGLCCPVSPVEAPTAPQEVSPTAAVGSGTPSFLPNAESCAITTTTQTGRTDEEERRRGSRGRGEEPRAGPERVGPDAAHGAKT